MHLLGSITSVEPNKGWHTSLSFRRVATRLCVCRPAHPLVDEDGVSPHFIRHNHSLESEISIVSSPLS